MGTTSIELENGVAINEPTTYAVRVAIEQAVYEMIQEGIKRKIWAAKSSAGETIKRNEIEVNSTMNEK
jgi:hypothetical protein